MTQHEKQKHQFQYSKNPHLNKATQKILEKKIPTSKIFKPNKSGAPPCPPPLGNYLVTLKVNKRSCISGTEPQVPRRWPNNSEANTEIKIGTGSCIVARDEGSNKGLYASVQGECTTCTPSSAYTYFSVSFIIALTICADSCGSAPERLDIQNIFYLVSKKEILLSVALQ